MSSKVSIIVPVYGVEKYIERCARSLFGQTFKDIEYIFVDDCTLDQSIQVLERVAVDYPDANVRIIRKAVNGGLPQARKTGWEAATGDYVLHVDSDDWIEPDMVETLYNRAIAENADMVCCDWLEEYIDRQEVKKQQPLPWNQYYMKILSLEAEAYVWCRLVKRSLYEGLVFPVENMFEDFVITSQLLKRCQVVAFESGAYYHYLRNNVNSICASGNEIKTLTQEIKNIYLVYANVKDEFPVGKKSRALARMSFAMGWHAMRHNLWHVMTQEMCDNIRAGVKQHLPYWGLGFSWLKQVLLYLVVVLK